MQNYQQMNIETKWRFGDVGTAETAGFEEASQHVVIRQSELG